LTSSPDQIYTEPPCEVEDTTTEKTERFEELLAEAVYEGLSWVSSLVAPVLDSYIQGSTTVETGFRKSRMNRQDCEAFEKGLERVLRFGAKVIEYRILKILYAKLETSEHIEQNFRFTDEVETAKKLYKSKLHARSTH